MNTRRWLRFLLPALPAMALPVFSADPPKAPVPPSPYLPVIYRYADAMLAKGRDTAGPQKTGLFLSALDRTTTGPLTTRPPAPSGVAEAHRAGPANGPLTGANLQHDENFLRLLYTLSELSSKPVYREAADGALKWALQHAPAPDMDFVWDTLKDEKFVTTGSGAPYRYLRPWMLWDRCFDLAPEPSKQFALAWPGDNAIAQREEGFHLRALAVTYARTKDERCLHLIEEVLSRFERKHASPVASLLSMAIDCDGAARRLTDPLAPRLRGFAASGDAAFLGLPHDLKGKGGFVSGFKPESGLTSLWEEKEGARTTAAVALMCLARYENIGSTAYRDLIVSAAEFYLKSPPPENADTWPLTFGHAISLQVAAWRHTSRQAHLDCARRFADTAVEKFWGTGVLPRASLKTDHYETITGADTLALALVELHLNILHITAVRCPPNTIDR